MKVRKEDRAITVKAERGVLSEIKTTVQVSPTPLSPGPFPPNFRETWALWDTGATNTAISDSLAHDLGLLPIGKADVSGAHGVKTVDVFLVDVLLPNNAGVKSVKVTEAALEEPLGLLIGMDIITLGDFVFTNVNGNSVFSFRIPSRGPEIDFVKDINRLRQTKKSQGKKPKPRNRR